MPGPAAVVRLGSDFAAGEASRVALARLLSRGRVTAVFAGHNHRYERRTIDGVPLFTVGTGGAPRNANERFTPRSPDAAASLPEFGVMRVDDSSGRVAFTFLDASGVVRDRWILQ